MNFFFFHLMPYGDPEPASDRKCGPDWGNLPYSCCDPAKGGALYNRYLDEFEYAEELGFDGGVINEHHQSAHGMVPVPGVIARALARRTKAVKIAVRESKPLVEAFMNGLLTLPPEMLLPSGYGSLDSMKREMQAKEVFTGGSRRAEELNELGSFMCGSPATIVERLKEYQARAGVGTLLPALQFGTLPAGLTKKSMELFAKEVMPHLR